MSEKRGNTQSQRVLWPKTKNKFQQLNSVVESCQNIQEELVELWSDIQDNFTISNKKDPIKLEHKTYWQNNREYTRGKQRIMENRRKEQQRLTGKKIENIKQLLIPEFVNKTQRKKYRYIKSEDFDNVKFYKILASNKRKFGKKFSQQIRLPKSLQLRNISDGLNTQRCVSQQNYQQNWETNHHFSQRGKNYKNFTERLENMKPLNKFIFSEYRKVTPGFLNEFKIKSKAKIDQKMESIKPSNEIQQYSNLLMKRNQQRVITQSPSPKIPPSPTRSHTRHMSVQDMGSTLFQYSQFGVPKQENRIIDDIITHLNDLDYKKRVEKMVQDRRHKEKIKQAKITNPNDN